MSVTGAVEMMREPPPGRHHTSVQTGSGLRRSHCRKAKSLASTMSEARAYPLEPSPAARHSHAAASDEASVNNEAATTNAARVRPIPGSPLRLWPCPAVRARVFLAVSFGDLRAAWAYCRLLRWTPRACSAPIESGGFSWGQRWESLSALIRFWEAGRCRRPILGRCGNE